jgi:hypothetical protein
MSEEFSVKDWAKEGADAVKAKIPMPKGNLMPEAFWNHLRQSRVEFLSAFRSLFDEAIDRMQDLKSSESKANSIKAK